MELLMPIYRTASTFAEPGCITYRINRTLDRSQVLVYEEYANEEAYKVRNETWTGLDVLRPSSEC